MRPPPFNRATISTNSHPMNLAYLLIAAALGIPCAIFGCFAWQYWRYALDRKHDLEGKFNPHQK